MRQRELKPGRETVVKPANIGWPFTLPDAHTIELYDGETAYALLDDGYSSTIYRLIGIDDASDPEEVIVLIGDAVAWAGPAAWVPDGEKAPSATGYAEPTIDIELERLRARWGDLGGDVTKFNAWAKDSETGRDESYAEHLRWLRGELRKLASRGRS